MNSLYRNHRKEITMDLSNVVVVSAPAGLSRKRFAASSFIETPSAKLVIEEEGKHII